MSSPLSSTKVIAHSRPHDLGVQHPEVTSPLIAVSKGEHRLAILMFSAIEPPPPPQATSILVSPGHTGTHTGMVRNVRGMVRKVHFLTLAQITWKTTQGRTV